jgi:hypothetical protein
LRAPRPVRSSSAAPQGLETASARALWRRSTNLALPLPLPLPPPRPLGPALVAPTSGCSARSGRPVSSTTPTVLSMPFTPTCPRPVVVTPPDAIADAFRARGRACPVESSARAHGAVPGRRGQRLVGVRSGSAAACPQPRVGVRLLRVRRMADFFTLADERPPVAHLCENGSARRGVLPDPSGDVRQHDRRRGPGPPRPRPRSGVIGPALGGVEETSGDD